jgi:adenylate cyclase
MRHEIATDVIRKVVGEIESACGKPLPPEDLQRAMQRVHQLLAEVIGQPRPTEHKQVSILLSDLRGFTALAQRLRPGDLIALLNRYFTRMCEVIVAHRGTIDKFMGDGIMVLFGAPDTGRDDLVRAISCATAMQRAMSEVNAVNASLGMPQLFMGIGIHTGEVVAADVGSDLHREYTVIGDTVNLTSRIVAHSLRGQVLLSEQSYRLASDYISIGDVKEVWVKGQPDPVKLFELHATQLPTPMEVPARELRRGPRVKTDMPLQFQIVEDKHVLPRIYSGHIADISDSGMLARVNTRLPAHAEIKFSIALSLLSPAVADIYGRILRVTETSPEYEYNVEFTSIDDAGQRAVREFVDVRVSEA